MKTFASRIFLVLAALTLLDQRSDTPRRDRMLRWVRQLEA
jgi:hypothetical protein